MLERTASAPEVLVRDLIDPVEFVTRTGGVDLTLDPQGTSLLKLDLGLLRPGGLIVLFGNASGGPLESLPPVPGLFAQNASIGGFSLASLAATAPEIVAGALARTLQALASKALHTEAQVVDGLEAAPAVHQALADGRGAGKYVARSAAAETPYADFTSGTRVRNNCRDSGQSGPDTGFRLSGPRRPGMISS